MKEIEKLIQFQSVETSLASLDRVKTDLEKARIDHTKAEDEQSQVEAKQSNRMLLFWSIPRIEDIY